MFLAMILPLLLPAGQLGAHFAASLNADGVVQVGKPTLYLQGGACHQLLRSAGRKIRRSPTAASNCVLFVVYCMDDVVR